MYHENIDFKRPSRLFHLKPIGIGTPYVEKLTSYIKRLAEAHLNTPGILLSQEIIPNINKGYLRINHIIGMESNKNINSISEINESIVKVLKEKTCNHNLEYLTMSAWEEYFVSKNMFRKNQAWCPICYEESLQFKQPIYEQLIWSFKDVNICGKHQTRLIQKCPYCNREFATINYQSRIGFCDICNSWLGSKRDESIDVLSINKEWDNWVYDNVGQLLAVTPSLKEIGSLKLSRNITAILTFNKISQRRLGNEINVIHDRIRGWIKGTKPTLIDVLGLSYKLKCSLVDILIREIDKLNIDINNVSAIKNKNSKNNIIMDELRNKVNKVVSSNKRISIKKLSAICGVSPWTIRKHFPSEVTKIKENYSQNIKDCRLERLDLIKDTMKSLVQKGIFPSRKALSRKLGKRTVINDYERRVWLETLEELGCTSEDFTIGSRK